jgi:flagellar motor switch protein FliM
VAEILTQKDLDALILSLTADEPLAAGVPEKGPKQKPHLVRVYDFRRPDKFSRDQIRTVEMLHDNIARLCSTYVAGQVRSLCTVTVSSVDQMTFEEFIKLIPNPSYISTVTLEPLKGRMFMVLDGVISLVIVDRLFGGPGLMSGPSRPLTEIEMAIMGRVANGILSQMKESWVSLVSIEPKLEETSSNPTFIDGGSSNEMTVVVRFDIKIGKAAGTITFCLPFIVMEPVLPRLSAKNWFTQARREQGGATDGAVSGRIQRIQVDMVAQLGKATLPVQEILDLEVGDVIELEQRVMDEITILVEDRRKFKATPGRSGQRLCFRINHVLREEDENG